MAMEVAYTTSFPGTALSSWETGQWARVGTATSESFNNPGFNGVFGPGDGYFLPLTAINVNPARDFTVELTIPSATTYYMGPATVDAAGAGAYAANWNSPLNCLILTLSNYQYPGGFQSGPGFATYPSIIRMNKTASGYNTTFSTNGGSTWSAPSSNIAPSTGALTRVGFVQGGPGTADQSFTFSQFRVLRDLPAAVPAAPTNVSVMAATTYANVDWTAVNESDYYEYRLNGGVATTTTNFYNPNTIVSGLSPSTTYTVEIRGVNSNGPGAWSAVKTFTTPATVYYLDSFNRADNNASLGTPDTGGPYVVQAGTWGVSSSQAYTPSSVAAAHVTMDIGVTDFDFSATFPAMGVSYGLIFDWTDANNFSLVERTNGSVINVWRRIGGTFNKIVGWSNTSANGDKIRVVCKSDMIWVELNGILRETVINGFTRTTVIGFYNSSSTACRIDNAIAIPFASPPGGVDGTSGTIPSNSLLDLATADNQYTAFVYKGRNTKTEDSVSGAG